MKLTGIVLAKDEENNIKQCLASISFCDELLVIDDNSTDKTSVIAKKEGAKVYQRTLNGDFASQRNFGLEKAKGKWVLFVDADERVSKKLKDEILEEIKKENNTNVGYLIKRSDYIIGKTLKYGESGNIRLLRLARKNAGKWVRCVHEEWKIVGKVEKLENPLLHYPHPTLSKFIDNINYYSSLHALANKEEGKNATLAKIIFLPIFKFIRNYFCKLGILDGPQGFIVAMMMSLHSYLSWSKLWMLQKKVYYQN